MKKRVIRLFSTVLALTVVLSTCLAGCKEEPTPRITVTPAGDSVITIEYTQEYVDPGAEATYLLPGDTGALEVETSGQVDTGTLGSYYIKYLARMADTVATAYRRVDVVDTTAPVITLTGEPNFESGYGWQYQEQGFTATDNHDGDITHLVRRDHTAENICYTVTDASGNTTTAIRWIADQDTTPPLLTLNEGDYYNYPAGVAYQDPGFTAIDNRDGDITAKVTMSGWVDMLTPGDYVLTYTVTDEFQNTTVLNRTVHVYPQEPVQEIIPEGNVIYLTFDDGPGPYTEQLLEILRRYNVKATFFVVNNEYSHLIKRIVEEGHSIGIHTTSHKFKEVYANDEAYLNDLYTMQDIIRNVSGVETRLMRFPGGSSNTVSKKYSRGIMTRMTQKVVELGFQYFDWNVDSDDAGGAKTAYEVLGNVIDGVSKRSTSVVLQHDIKSYSVEAVEQILAWGLANGYAFLPLTTNSLGAHHNINN